MKHTVRQLATRSDRAETVAVLSGALRSALMHPVLQRCDLEATPAYTETQTSANAAW